LYSFVFSGWFNTLLSFIMNFQLQSDYQPQGDQPKAIEALSRGLEEAREHQVLLGVTGSGKTFTVANLIQKWNRPTLIISHNKTLAAQLFSEFKQFFPKNAVEYFVSYFDYYQPEAYIPHTDTYIEKDSSINDEIERLRLSATSSLLTRQDVIVVASVSCIYGLGSPDDYHEMISPIEKGKRMEREDLLSRLVEMMYERNDTAFTRSKFRVRGDIVELWPAYAEEGIRVEFFGDEIERISRFDPLTGHVQEVLSQYVIFPARHFVTPHDKLRRAMGTIRQELELRVAELEKQNKLVEAQRLRQRTQYDLEMMEEIGFCKGIENYSRHLTGRPPGSRPYTLIDFFPKDFLMVIDESHVTIPQIGGMYAGDRSRKTVLVDHGFRLPSALDNRPFQFPEFEEVVARRLYVSATPGPFELAKVHGEVVEQIIRPTGLLDPEISIKPLKTQIDDLIEQIRLRVEKQERVLVVTLTKRTSEDLTDYLRDLKIKVQYLHSEVDTIERVEILRSLRAGDFDVLIGINLLREGLDLPEVSLVAILDADKEGFLRSDTSLIQTAGRAARHQNGHVILYADTMTKSIQKLLAVTKQRREKQIAYNQAHGITPTSVKRSVQESLKQPVAKSEDHSGKPLTEGSKEELIQQLEEEMRGASRELDFERAAILRDQVQELKGEGKSVKSGSPKPYRFPKKGKGSKSLS
jgi:excinuclease ABC subunit B